MISTDEYIHPSVANTNATGKIFSWWVTASEASNMRGVTIPYASNCLRKLIEVDRYVISTSSMAQSPTSHLSRSLFIVHEITT